MSTDVATTPRKPLTPSQRLKLFERHRGLCSICRGKIVGKFIDEHMTALGLGGSNAPENRGIAHPKCAEVKTREEDMPRINKAKAQKRAAHGLKDETALAGRSPEQKRAAKQVNAKPAASGVPEIARRYGATR